jgi:hypothetical protein
MKVQIWSDDGEELLNDIDVPKRIDENVNIKMDFVAEVLNMITMVKKAGYK